MADHAGVHVQTLYKQFKNKEELAIAAAELATPSSTVTITPSLFGNYAFDGVGLTLLKSDAASKIASNIHEISFIDLNCSGHIHALR